MDKVAITGMGAVSSLGNTHMVMWQAMLSGKSGVGPLTRLSDPRLSSPYSGEVKGFSVTPFLKTPKLKRHVTTASGFLIAATHEALSEAGYLSPESRRGLRVALIVGTGSQLAEDSMGQSPEDRHPLWYLSTFPNLCTSLLTINFQLEGYSNTVVNACASGAMALVSAATMLRRNECDVAIVGACESKISLQHMLGFQHLGLLAKHASASEALRPFDCDRNGTVLGEGAGALVLESFGRAARRKSKIYSFVAGGGVSADAFRITEAPADGSGVFRAMHEAMADARVDPDQVRYVNSHGTGTRANDLAESFAIGRVLGGSQNRFAVNSSKSMLGHTTAASGVLEAIVCSHSLHSQQIHPTRNFVRIGDVCPLDYTAGDARDWPMRYALSNSSGIGGLNISVLFERGPLAKEASVPASSSLVMDL